jgi:hypothetical protein
MKFRNFMLVTAVCLLALPLAASAATEGPTIKPGKWEVTVQMDMPGMQMPAQTVTQCISQADAESVIPKMQDAGCKVSDVVMSGNTVTWKVACEAQHLTGSGKLTFDETSYSGEAHLKVAETEMTMKYAGKRIGACDK